MAEQPRREEAVVLLLQARADFTPAAATWTGNLQRRNTTRGPAPFKRMTCETCRGTGKLRGGWACRECAGRGTFAVDAYTGEPVDTEETSWQELLATTVRCSRCGGGNRSCDLCQGSGVEPALFAGKADLTGGDASRPSRVVHGDRMLDLLERGHEALRHPAQQALTGCLDRLAGTNPGARFYVRWTFELGEERPECLLPAARTVLEWAVAQLAEWMPAEFCALRPPRLELPAPVYASWYARRAALEPGLAKIAAQARGGNRSAQKRRDAEIRTLHASGGWSRSALARRFGLSYRRVAEIVQAEAA